MTLYFENENNYEIEFDWEEIATKVILEALRYLEFTYDWQVSLTLVDNDQIKEINSQFRDIDKVTDVLSFPMIDFAGQDGFDFIGQDDSYFDIDSQEVVLGDIMICVPRMLEQADAYNHSNLREFAFLVAHSVLHLLGYDHIDDKEREYMEKLQNDILNNLNIKRD